MSIYDGLETHSTDMIYTLFSFANMSWKQGARPQKQLLFNLMGWERFLSMQSIAVKLQKEKKHESKTTVTNIF